MEKIKQNFMLKSESFKRLKKRMNEGNGFLSVKQDFVATIHGEAQPR